MNKERKHTPLPTPRRKGEAETGNGNRMAPGFDAACRQPISLSPPRKRLGIHTSCELTQGVSTESPLPLWERDRVMGLAPAGADGTAAGSRTGNLDVGRQFPNFHVSALNEVSSRCRASPLTLSLSHKGRGDSVRRSCVIANLCASPSAKAGVQGKQRVVALDSRFRGNDREMVSLHATAVRNRRAMRKSRPRYAPALPRHSAL